ncbi:hypothetical protein EVAR_8114_1 [Eumeta japonica]|uniref:Uncharacterized protein n=1 Tax=Eumeta variegata TaxID=151549 RepID=A0A4C1TSR1_EUMVA|nr:hypothetical protein EVAR_8114_1 [Eumeta japonica]
MQLRRKHWYWTLQRRKLSVHLCCRPRYLHLLLKSETAPHVGEPTLEPVLSVNKPFLLAMSLLPDFHEKDAQIKNQSNRDHHRSIGLRHLSVTV